MKITARIARRAILCAALLSAAPALAQQEVAPAANNGVIIATEGEIAPQTDADPALWVMRDEDTTIYLFGTVHVLRPGLRWFDEAVQTAFNASDELKIEVVLPESQAEMMPMVMRLATYPAGTTLSSRLTPAQNSQLSTGMARIGLPRAQLEHFEPWFVSTAATMVLAGRAGFQPGAGAEATLTAEARRMNKPITALETVQEQLGYMDSTPESEQINGLLKTLSDPAAASAAFNQLVDSWATGNPDATGALMNEGLRETPETARILLTDRNRRWATALQARMAQPGTIFVAVGAGHLSGEQNVQHFLTAAGLTVTRVAY